MHLCVCLLDLLSPYCWFTNHTDCFLLQTFTPAVASSYAQAFTAAPQGFCSVAPTFAQTTATAVASVRLLTPPMCTPNVTTVCCSTHQADLSALLAALHLLPNARHLPQLMHTMPHACRSCCPSLWRSSTGWSLQAYASSGAGTSVASASASASVVQATNNTIAALTQVAAAAGGPTNLCCLGAAYADILVALLEAKSPQVSRLVDVLLTGRNFSSQVNVLVA